MQFIIGILLLSSCLQISNGLSLFKSKKEKQVAEPNWKNLGVMVAKYSDSKKASYIHLPESTSAAKKLNWSGGRLPKTDVELYCQSEDTVLCGLYDKDDGKLVGVQFAISQPAERMRVDGSKEKSKKVKSYSSAVIKDAFQLRSINRKNLLVLDVIFPHHLQQLQGLPVKSSQHLSSHKITVFGKHVRQISTKESELEEPNWYKQNCEDEKGTHYGFGLTKEYLCKEYYPVIPLVKSKHVVGLLFMVPGMQSSPMHWIQTLDKDYIKGKFPKTSKCFQQSIPYSAVHVSFVDPKEIGKCLKKDHVKNGIFDTLKSLG